MVAEVGTIGVATGTGNLNIRVLPFNERRKYAVITNDLATEVYLSIGTGAVLGRGILLNAKGSSYEINKDNFTNQEIRAAGTTGALRLVYQAY